MSNQYYIFYLSDYSSPAFVSSSKIYLGTEDQLNELCLKLGEVKSVKATVLKEKTIESAETTLFSYLNAWDFRYEVEIYSYTAQAVVAKYNNSYVIAVWAVLTNPKYRSEEFGEDIPNDFMPLNRRYWGYPMQIERQTQEDGTFYLSNKLAYVQKEFKSNEEAFAYLEQMTEPGFQGFFEDVFGDG